MSEQSPDVESPGEDGATARRPRDAATAPEPWGQRLAALAGIDDLEALTDHLVSLRRAQRRQEPRPRRTYDLGGALPEGGLQVAPIEPGADLAVAWSRRPRRAPASPGLSGRCVKVTADRPFRFARLRFALPPARTTHLWPGTVLAARWDPAAGRFRLIPASGYSETGGHVYAQITRPGVFTALGLPRDPRVALALRLLATLAPWARADREDVAASALPILAAVMRLPPLAGLSQDDAFDRLPELDLLGVLDGPDPTAASAPHLPDVWPTPRGRWRGLGPANVAGRIKALVVHPANGDVVYAGAAGGGVWKTTDGGRGWFPTMEDERALAIGGLALAPSDPAVLYAATGEWTGNDAMAETPSGEGGGVYRSADGGGSWVRCAPVGSNLCTAVAVDPRDPDRVFVGGNGGLHLSEDGGMRWRDLDIAGGPADGSVPTVTSVVIVPGDPDRIYAGVHGRGVLRSLDGGATWRRALPHAEDTAADAIAPKLALGRGGRHGARAVVVKMGDAVFASTGGSDRFARLPETGDSSRPMIPWCNTVAVHPENTERILAGGKNLYRTADGGRSWTRVGGYGTAVHEDQQAIAFDPADPNRVYLANDGGVYLSHDGGATWVERSAGLCAAQVYNIGVADGPALRCAASLQDASAHIFDGRDDWADLNLGEDGSIHFVPGRPDRVFAVSRWSSLTLLEETRAGSWKIVEEGPDIALRVLQPLAVSRRRPEIVVAIAADGRSLLRRPPSGGYDWPAVLEMAEGRLTAVAALHDAFGKRERFCAGDDAGRLWRSDDGGRRWVRVALDGSELGAVVALRGDPSDPDRLYVGTGDTRAWALWRVALTGGNCARLWRAEHVRPLRWPRSPAGIVVHPALDDTLVIAGDTGVFRSVDGGASWAPFDDGLRRAKPMALDQWVNGRWIVLGTHGAGVYARPL